MKGWILKCRIHIKAGKGKVKFDIRKCKVFLEECMGLKL